MATGRLPTINTSSDPEPLRLRAVSFTDAHDRGREERRALHEQRRAAAARQLRRLAVELWELDR